MLREYWGYDSFRPMQEEIIRCLLSGRDVAAVMPTGGGKSLCYQLPAVVMARTAVVVSPLIALMDDQVQQLAEIGIPAATLHSAIPVAMQRQVMMRAAHGELRLVYLSPERMAREDTIQWLRQVAPAFFAIDEAHCISEWGHEFRPEYRELGRLRREFPTVPIAAFTASATRQVRHDILEQLQLAQPGRFIRSFYRPNLRFYVTRIDALAQSRMLHQAVDHYEGDVIVYAPTIAMVTETAAYLNQHGIAASHYHGQMDATTRRRNQDEWMNGDTRVMVGTLAFGMGINKAAVRAVIHLALPKSVEQYYQEAGRAGRDGEPADCLLLWRKQDTALHAHFISEIKDDLERERAWQRYHTIKRFVSEDTCRHMQLCLHFGETPKWERCGVCDACGWTPAWHDTQRRAAVTPDNVFVISREPVAEKPAPLAAVDRGLVAALKLWRLRRAREAGVPAYVILTDATVDDLSRRRPRDLHQLLEVTGIGHKKAETYGLEILEIVGSPMLTPTRSAIASLLQSGLDLAGVAANLNIQVGTLITHLAEMIEAGNVALAQEWVAADVRQRIEAAATECGLERLKPIKEKLGEDVSYEDIRLVVAHLRKAARG